MPDVFTKSKRSKVMSHIRGSGNKDTELAMMRIFRMHRITGWRRHVSVSLKDQGSRFKVRGSRSTSPRPTVQHGEGGGFRVRPDFVFPKLRLAVFVDGCFWHSCPLHATQPKNNAAFWRKKLTGNKARDVLVTRALRKRGWRVLRLWEHDLSRKRRARLLERIEKRWQHVPGRDRM
jgi:DNA mismatch endonuclease (patch repair protein)